MRPRTSRRISPAFSRALMCFDAAASDIAKGSRQLADRALARGEFAQHAPAGGVAQGVEDGIQLGATNSTMWLNIGPHF